MEDVAEERISRDDDSSSIENPSSSFMWDDGSLVGAFTSCRVIPKDTMCAMNVCLELVALEVLVFERV